MVLNSKKPEIGRYFFCYVTRERLRSRKIKVFGKPAKPMGKPEIGATLENKGLFCNAIEGKILYVSSFAFLAL